MRFITGLCAVAILGGGAAAQAPDSTRPALAPIPSGPGPLATRPAGDTIVLTRRDAIAQALARNAQLEVAREQTAQARARKVTATAIPDPQLTAGYDQLTNPFSLGGAGSRPV